MLRHVRAQSRCAELAPLESHGVRDAVRDIIELPVDVEALLPGDDSVGGFDNIGSALALLRRRCYRRTSAPPPR